MYFSFPKPFILNPWKKKILWKTALTKLLLNVFASIGLKCHLYKQENSKRFFTSVFWILKKVYLDFEPKWSFLVSQVDDDGISAQKKLNGDDNTVTKSEFKD